MALWCGPYVSSNANFSMKVSNYKTGVNCEYAWEYINNIGMKIGALLYMLHCPSINTGVYLDAINITV